MQIPIKQLILEGYSFEAIVENVIEEGAIGKVWKNLADHYGLVRVNANKNSKENFSRYLLHPMVDGPLTQLNATVRQSILNLLLKIFSDEKISTIGELTKKLEKISKGSDYISRQFAIIVEDLKGNPELHKQLIDEHFIQWLINPLVPGPLNRHFSKNFLETIKEMQKKEKGMKYLNK